MAELLGVILHSIWSFAGTMILLSALGDIAVKLWSLTVSALADVAKEAVRRRDPAPAAKPDPEFAEF